MRKPVQASAENAPRCIFKKRTQQISKLAWLAKALTTEPDSLSLIPRTHIAKGDSQVLQAVLQLPDSRCGKSTLAYPPPHTNKQMFKKKNKERSSKLDI